MRPVTGSAGRARRPARCATGMGRPDRGPECRRVRRSAVRRRRADPHADDHEAFAGAARGLATSSRSATWRGAAPRTLPWLAEPHDLAAPRAALKRLLAYG